tara:strand:- start:159 stop:365 length:207 start_codon:yes stop_codon:yes gene_type:complete
MLSVGVDKISKSKKSQKNYKVKKIINEYKLKMNSFYPNNKSPNLFVNKLEYRMKQYYDLYKSTNAKMQ